MTFTSFRANGISGKFNRITGARKQRRAQAIGLLSLTLLLQHCLPTASLAASKSSQQTQAPAGTMLLPLTPRMDDGTTPPPTSNTSSSYGQLVIPTPAPSKKRSPKSTTARNQGSNSASSSSSSSTSSSGASGKSSSSSSLASISPSTRSTSSPVTVRNSQPAPPRPLTARPNSELKSAPTFQSSSTSDDRNTSGVMQPPPTPAQQNISAESGPADDSDGMVDENSLLKGTVQIVADDTEYDQEKNTFLGSGNAVAVIAGQNSKLEADTILYDQNNGTIDARGNVKILREGQLTTGSSFKFKVESDEYLITDPDTELEGTTVVARKGKGTKEGIAFRNGQFTMPQPVVISNNAFYGPTSAAEEMAYTKQHPDAYVPAKQSFKFTARKMTYERYKKDGNLTVYGGKMKFDHFTLPLPHFTATVGATNSRVVFPVTPYIGNNLMVGGVNVGPQFNYGVGKTGAFSWAPLIQYGGRTATDTNSGKLGAGMKIGYSNDRLSAHLAYGSVSNLLVGDFKYTRNDHQYFQSGINRFLNDGMFGMRRARLLAEAVDTRYVNHIPYVSMLSFRTSAGWAQDNPSLVSLSGNQYAQLFKQTHTGKVSAYRLQEQIIVSSHPIFAYGDDKYGVNMNLVGGVSAKAYSTGDSMLMGQFGPQINARLGRVRLQGGYAQSGVRGQSPFIFDQFIQGNRSVSFSGDVKVAKWLTLGTRLGYNLDAKMLYNRSITAAIGPQDCKLMISRDTISGYQRLGFGVMYGDPVKFDTLKVKQSSDAGQLGGI